MNNGNRNLPAVFRHKLRLRVIPPHPLGNGHAWKCLYYASRAPGLDLLCAKLIDSSDGVFRWKLPWIGNGNRVWRTTSLEDFLTIAEFQGWKVDIESLPIVEIENAEGRQA